MVRAELTLLSIEGLTETYYRSAKLSGGTKKRLVYVPAMNNIYALRENAAPMVAAQHHEVDVSNLGAGGPKRLADTSQPNRRTILCQGHVKAGRVFGIDSEKGVSARADRLRALG